MGRNKALILVEGRPMISRLAAEASLLSDQVLISANDVSAYEAFGLPVIPDVYRGQGPLAGLHAAMTRADRPLVLALACDLPSIKEPFLRRLVEIAEDYDAVVPVTSDGRPHPLCAVYHRSCLPALEHNLQKDMNKVTDFLQDPTLHVNWLSAGQGFFREEDLRNINTPKDLASFLANLAKSNI